MFYFNVVEGLKMWTKNTGLSRFRDGNRLVGSQRGKTASCTYDDFVNALCVDWNSALKAGEEIKIFFNAKGSVYHAEYDGYFHISKRGVRYFRKVEVVCWCSDEEEIDAWVFRSDRPSSGSRG